MTTTHKILGEYAGSASHAKLASYVQTTLKPDTEFIAEKASDGTLAAMYYAMTQDLFLDSADTSVTIRTTNDDSYDNMPALPEGGYEIGWVDLVTNSYARGSDRRFRLSLNYATAEWECAVYEVDAPDSNLFYRAGNLRAGVTGIEDATNAAWIWKPVEKRDLGVSTSQAPASGEILELRRETCPKCFMERSSTGGCNCIS